MTIEPTFEVKKMKVDQIAYHVNTQEDELKVKRMYGLEHAAWIQDAVTARGTVYGKPTVNVALLQFNSDLGLQLELIRYKAGLFWYRHMFDRFDAPFVVHVGVHLDDDEPWPRSSGKLAQEVETISHTATHLNPGGVLAGRRYWYRIYQLSSHSFVKYIKRIHPKEGYNAKAAEQEAAA